MESYARYGPALVRKAERLLENPDDAIDVVHGLFLDLIASGGEEPDLPYLYRAVTNRCLSLIRDEKNRRRLLERQAPALRGPARTAVDDAVIDLALLTELVGRLDEETCELLVLHFWDDMPQGEIAELTGVSRKTIVRRIAHIREEVARLVGKEVPA